MPTVLDLHVHTTKAGPHSELTPLEMIELGKRIGLTGVSITEHNRVWDARDTRALSEQHEFLILRGMEVNTELGHIAIFGLEEFVGGLHRMTELRRVADEISGFLVVLHPFRRLLTLSRNTRGELVEPVDFERALELPVWEYVDAVEVLNGANTDDENALAYRVAPALRPAWHRRQRRPLDARDGLLHDLLPGRSAHGSRPARRPQGRRLPPGAGPAFWESHSLPTGSGRSRESLTAVPGSKFNVADCLLRLLRLECSTWD